MNMKAKTMRTLTAPVVLAATLLVLPALAEAAIDGVQVTGSITLYARADYVVAGDGGSISMWGLTEKPTGRAQYPSPTLILEQGDVPITVTLVNELSVPTSLVFPGHDVTACTGAAGTLTCEAAASGGTATYTFTPTDAGTYQYHSGTDPDVQVEMGLLGAIVVRPYGFDALHPRAYGDPASAYDREYLFVLSEMDPAIHDMVDFGDSFVGREELGDYFSKYWFLNGRTAPDTMAAPDVPWLPAQPYNSLPRMNPGDRVLMRVVSAGRDLHPFHNHGNHARVIARDGRLLSSAPGAGADLSYEVFTIQAVPGETYDAIFQWTGKDLGWDAYGDPTDPAFAHTCSDSVDNRSGLPPADGYDDTTWEYCADHGKPFPVVLPANQNLAFGGFWSGSPFMGSAGALPPGEGGLNPNSGFTFMWHSHTEKELTNFDIFPGGMMTMLIVEPPGVEIP
jgi:hypothetical protein